MLAVRSFETAKQMFQYTSFFLSLFFNSLLIILVLTRSPKKMGSYKYLMIFFSVFAICFSTMDIILKPYLLSTGTCFIVVSDIHNLVTGFGGGVMMISLLCGCFGGVISSIAVHFIFRYFALERKGKLVYFEGRYLAGWLTIPLLLTSLWSYITYYFLQPTDIVTEYVKNYLNNEYGLVSENVSYIATLYFPPDEFGVERFDKNVIPPITFFAFIITTSLAIVFYFGVKSYNRIQKLIYEGSSDFTKNLQSQLYKSLVVQACIPIFLMYIPIGIYIFLPLFGFDLGYFNNFVTFTYALYPAIDPLPIIFMIDNYRDTVLGVLKCGAKNKVSLEEDNSTTRQMSA